ncbi:hypothetical protein DFH29DRAFT_985902 [Suillus ampliporus]|nr:hypothetical protein DFH29DRAFT_985902 [Suillus ampliporus]
MLKHSGRGHNPSSKTTAEGECTILCPACPHPGKNLPTDWKESPWQWLYVLFLAIDANFQLKRKAVSNDNVDPSLSCGWGYFVEEEAYKSFLHSSADCIQEVLYINMDYLFFSTLHHTVLHTLNVSYDIACQWHKTLWHCMSHQDCLVFVLKFHLPTHIEQCQTSFSFNFKSRVGRTDGEAPGCLGSSNTNFFD